MEIPEWTDLPEELIDLTAKRFSSNIDVVRIRSICKSWRSAVATKQNSFQRHNLPSSNKNIETLLSPTTFFRVYVPSSGSYKGWLIRTKQVSESSKISLLSPFSRQLLDPSQETLDLLKFGVSEIQKSYEIHIFDKDLIQSVKGKIGPSHRVVFLDNLFFAVGEDEKIWCCKSGEESSRIWTKIKNQVVDFSDIILHRGQVYALDITGAIWWINLSQLRLVKFTPPTPMNCDNCNKRLVDFCGNLCIVHQLRVRRDNIERTVGFKVYKMDEDVAKWVEVRSLEDKALIVARDSCFTVVALEYHGCLRNSIYFIDNVKRSEDEARKYFKHHNDSSESEYHGLLKNYVYFNDNDGEYCDYNGGNGEAVKMFKLGDGSIIDMTDFSSHSCFHMFFPPFL
ncbi:hypothetical protein ISN45_Aa04g006860 [Arabidopsis thaliana x Arabidopsis arenosa]|uniref:KIB1-4 beta-propeller domain-containing protein n=1 Tax=Arabidopsis thaliana x Arabidopsis arenosa TaxID=1240361 RepID=A0A8T2A2T6_9BRAS|nr:hypothetical protein ISN45_Aa04g006860 [Arabidopsis thaliana x Arabidopsis arenosa]